MTLSVSGEKHPNYGKQLLEETRKKISLAKSGENCSIEERLKKSLVKLGKSYSIVTCPHCNKVGGHNLMIRWHFDNCKQLTLNKSHIEVLPTLEDFLV